MKIRIYNSTENFWLSEDGQLAPDSLRVNGERAIQIAQILHAESAKTFNRLNSITTISFSLVREHASVREAEEYLIRHEADIPSSGAVEFICYDENGGESSFYLDTGYLKTTEAYYTGCSTTHSYVIVGGRITTTKPTS